MLRCCNLLSSQRVGGKPRSLSQPLRFKYISSWKEPINEGNTFRDVSEIYSATRFCKLLIWFGNAWILEPETSRCLRGFKWPMEVGNFTVQQPLRSNTRKWFSIKNASVRSFVASQFLKDTALALVNKLFRSVNCPISLVTTGNISCKIMYQVMHMEYHRTIGAANSSSRKNKPNLNHIISSNQPPVWLKICYAISLCIAKSQEGKVEWNMQKRPIQQTDRNTYTKYS